VAAVVLLGAQSEWIQPTRLHQGQAWKWREDNTESDTVVTEDRTEKTTNTGDKIIINKGSLKKNHHLRTLAKPQLTPLPTPPQIFGCLIIFLCGLRINKNGGFNTFGFIWM